MKQRLLEMVPFLMLALGLVCMSPASRIKRIGKATEISRELLRTWIESESSRK